MSIHGYFFQNSKYAISLFHGSNDHCYLYIVFHTISNHSSHQNFTLGSDFKQDLSRNPGNIFHMKPSL